MGREGCCRSNYMVDVLSADGLRSCRDNDEKERRRLNGVAAELVFISVCLWSCFNVGSRFGLGLNRGAMRTTQDNRYPFAFVFGCIIYPSSRGLLPVINKMCL